MTTELRRQRDLERKERTRSRLLDAAAAVFLRRGYHHTLISDVVAEAGVGQGTFYRHFADKRAVLDVLLDRLVDALFREFAPMSANLPASSAAYRAASVEALEHVADVMSRNGDLLQLLLRDGPGIDAAFRARIEGIQDRFAALAGQYLSHAIDHGFARACDVEVVSQALVGIGVRLVHLWLQGQLAGDARRRVIAEVVDLAFMGFGPRLAQAEE